MQPAAADAVLSAKGRIAVREILVSGGGQPEPMPIPPEHQDPDAPPPVQEPPGPIPIPPAPETPPMHVHGTRC
jgi:hypothetical protein